MNDASAMAGIQAMTYDENEYQQSLANKQRAEDLQKLIESAQIQKEFLEQGYNKASDYKSYIEAQNRYNELLKQGYKPSDSYGEALVYAAGSGTYDVLGKNTTAFADAVLGEPMRRIENSKWGQKLGIDLPGEYFGAMYGASKAQADINENYRFMDNFEYGGKGEQVGLNLSTVAGGMLPTILVSVLSGGTGAATGAKSVAGYLKQLAKSPTYWASVVNMGGSTYDSAIAEGATYEEALVSGLINGLVGAATETSGGFEKKLTNSNTFGNWLKSALEEGGEEVIQGVLENATKKAVYDHDRAVVSTSDENAVINPSRMASEFGYGALAGGLFSGGQILTSNIANTAYDAYTKNLEYDSIGKELELNGIDYVNSIINKAESFEVGSDVYKLAKKVKTELDKGNLDTTKLGKLYVEMEKTEKPSNSVPVLSQNDEGGDFDSKVNNSTNSYENKANGSISEDITFSEKVTDGVELSSGEDIEISRMEIKNDKVSFVTANNEVLTQKDVALTDEMHMVVSFAKNYPQITANTMLYAYKKYSEMPNAGGALMFSRSWNQMYQYGLTGSTTFDEAMEHVIKDIPRAIYESAYRMGQNDHKKEVEAKQKLADKKKTGIKAQGSVGSISEADAKAYKVSTVDMDALSAKQKAAVAVMEVISKALGVNTYFFSDSGAGKIHGIYRDGNIYLNVDAGHFHEQAVLRTAAHELTHHIQNASPKLYDELKSFIISQYHKNDKNTFDALVQDKMDSLNLSMEKAVDEVIADACEMMLQDGSAITELATKNKSLWENIKAFINTIVEKLKNAFKGVSESSAAAVELKKVLGEWTELQKMWNEALVESTVYKKTTSDEMFSLKELKGSDITKNKVIENAANEVVHMESVKSLEGNEFAKGDKKLSEQLLDYFSELGNKVNNPEIGEITLDKVAMKSSMGHGIGRKKAIAYKALPEVLENGKIIYFSDNWKERGYQTCAIAAPFNIGTEQYYMVAIVSNETYTDRYYTHDVAYTKIDDTLFKTGNKVKNNSINSGNVPSTYSLLYELVKVKREQENDLSEIVNQSTNGEEQYKKDRNAHYYKNIVPATREESKELNMLDDRNIARYRNEIDGVFNGEMKEGTMVLIGKPSEILLQHGVVNKPLFITQRVARKIAYPLEYKIGNKDMGGKHNLGMSALKNLPLQLCEPIAITKNTAKHSEDNSVVIWTNWIDRNNEGIMVAIRINKEGKIEISNTIATVFQAGEKYVNQFFENKDNILYTKNNEDIQKLLPFRRYVPEAKSDDVFVYRLLQENENVNSESEEYFSQEINSLSPRFILASTLMNAATSIDEQENLKKYKEAIKSIEDKEERLAITRNAIRNAIFEREAGLVVSMESVEKMKKAAKNLERSIDYWDKKLLELEATTPLKNLMERQRKSLSEKYMNEARTRLDETRARFYASNRREQIKKNANTLITWLNRPDNNHYIPDVMKQPVVEFLSSIDFVSSKASPDSNTTKEWVAKMDKLKEMLTDLEANTKDYRAQEFMDAVDPELKDNIRSFLANNQNNAKLSDLSPVETEKLHRIIVALKSAVTNANKFYANRMSANVGQLGSRTIRDLHKYKDKSNNSLLSSVDGFFNADMLDAYSYFNMMGESGLSIYDELREGFNKRVFLLKEASEYVDSHLLSNKTAKEKKKLLEEWTGSRAKVHEFKFKDYLGNDVSVKLTTGQLMNLYCLSRREQAMGHITVGGIRIKPAENKAVKGNVSGIHIGKSRLASWFSELTAEEKQTAEMMQRYLSATVSNWGNEVSQAMYGYDKFTEKNYWPIETDSNTNKSSDRTDGGTSLYQLKNMGITKAVTPKANNPLMVGDIFDVFSKHIGDMANYRGYVIPLMDAMKWYNYGNTFDVKDGEDSFTEFDSVKQQIERALGKDAKQYFIKLLQDINGGTPMDKTISEKFISSYKSASVGANLRVAIQQPTAYVRAAAVLDPKYLVKALGHKPAVKEMQEHSGVAQWKSYGYYDTGIGQSLKKIITGIDKPVENIRDKSMWLTGKADDITWGTIWNACKEEIKDTNPEAVDTEEFLKLVTKRFDEVIDRTQVVDTILHRTQIMRSKNAFNQMATSFMSEPSKSYNMLRNAIATMILNKDKASSLNAARTVSAWLISSVCTAAAASIVDAFRNSGDDEDKKLWERYVEAFKENSVDNINPLNMIPYLKEIPSLFEGYSPARMDMEALSSAVKFAKSMTKLAKGENTKYNAYYYVRQLAKVGSQFTGIPVYNVIRDFEGMWNAVPATPNITTKKDTAGSIGKSVAAEFMSGNTKTAKEEFIRLEEKIAEEYSSYSSDKVREVAASKVKSSITSEYKELYINGSSSERKKIMSSMSATGLYDGYEDVKSTCQSWEVSYWKGKYIKAKTGAERAEYRRKLYATGKWDSLDKLDADIRSWTTTK